MSAAPPTDEVPATSTEGVGEDTTAPGADVEVPVTWEDIYARVEDPRQRAWLEERRSLAERNGILDDLLKEDMSEKEAHSKELASLKELLAQAEKDRDAAKAQATALTEAQELQAAWAWTEDLLQKNPDWRASFEADEDDTGGAVGVYVGLLRKGLSEEEAASITRKRLGLPPLNGAPAVPAPAAPAPTPPALTAPKLKAAEEPPQEAQTPLRGVREQLRRAAPSKPIGNIFKD